MTDLRTDANYRQRIHDFFLRITEKYYFRYAVGDKNNLDNCLDRTDPKYAQRVEEAIVADLPRLITLTLKYRFAEFPTFAQRCATRFTQEVDLTWPEEILQKFSNFLDAHPELFAEYMSEGEKHSGSCEFCRGTLIFQVEAVNQKTGKIKNAIARCVCDTAKMKFGGIPEADGETLQNEKTSYGKSLDEARTYLLRLGIDPDRPVGFSEFRRTLESFCQKKDIPDPSKFSQKSPTQARASQPVDRELTPFESELVELIPSPVRELAAELGQEAKNFVWRLVNNGYRPDDPAIQTLLEYCREQGRTYRTFNSDILFRKYLEYHFSLFSQQRPVKPVLRHSQVTDDQQALNVFNEQIAGERAWFEDKPAF